MPIERAQSNGMTEAFVRTMNRDYVRFAETPDVRAVINQLPIWIDYYNTIHPHCALGYLALREYITHINPCGTVRDLRGNKNWQNTEKMLHRIQPLYERGAFASLELLAAFGDLLMILAGIPTAVLCAGTSEITTACAPMRAPSPMRTPPRIFAPAPT